MQIYSRHIDLDCVVKRFHYSIDMKRLVFNCVTGCIFAMAALAPLTVQAHPMLSEAVMEYIWANPRATDAEIDAWLQANPAEDVDDTREMMTMFRDLTDEQLQDITGTAAESGAVAAVSPITSALVAPWVQRAFAFIREGIVHIIGGPDHVLFVLSLLLIPLGMGALLRIITTFTIAHCCTFLLAGFGILQVPGSIVEPIIAFSIIYTALTTVFLRSHPFFGSAHNTLTTVFIFGLFHGLGFASVFTDLGITSSNFIVPLVSFNIGIEIGQLCIIGLAVPVLDSVRKLPQHTLYTKITAVLISAVACVWFVQRVL